MDFTNPLDGLFNGVGELFSGFGADSYGSTPAGRAEAAARANPELDYIEALYSLGGSLSTDARASARDMSRQQSSRAAQGKPTWGNAFSDALSELFGGGPQTGSTATNSGGKKGGGKGGKGGSSGGKGGGKSGSSGKGGNQGDAGVGGADGGR